MTYHRAPGSIAEAITKIVDALGGAARVGELLGIVSRWQLEAWKNPERNKWPNVQQAIELDRAYMFREGGEFPPPLLAAMEASLLRGSPAAEPAQYITKITEAQQCVGELLAFGLRELKAHGPGGEIQLDAETRRNLQGLAATAIAHLRHVEASLARGWPIERYSVERQ